MELTLYPIILIMVFFVAAELVLYVALLIMSLVAKAKQLDKLLNHPYIQGIIEEERTKKSNTNENK